MSRMILACLLMLGFSASVLGQSSAELRGTWVVQAEGRNLVVLHLQGDASGLSGTLQRPLNVTFGQAGGAGITVTEVKMPVTTLQATVVRSTSSGHVLSLSYEANKVGEFLIRTEGPDHARMGIGANTPESMMLPLVRVSDGAVVAADWVATQSYLVRVPAVEPNAELAEIFKADQADRQGNIDWSVVRPRDQARQKRVREMLDAGLLRAADDYYAAAFVFQHGDKPEDHLLAHVLAMGAMTLGRSDAAWIATATLDRYLHNTGKAQVFGTQYQGQPGTPLTQGAYDVALIPDSLRLLMGVPTREQQLERLKQMNTSPPGAPPQP